MPLPQDPPLVDRGKVSEVTACTIGTTSTRERAELVHWAWGEEEKEKVSQA